METQRTRPGLGEQILVVMDSAPGFFDALQALAANLPRTAQTYLTLLCCCPTPYWEHGGAGTSETRDELASVWNEEEAQFSRAEHCLAEAKAILNAAGIPLSHVLTRTTTHDSLLAATLEELKRGQHSGIIIAHYHHDIINRLLRKGVTDAFRQIPRVEVLALDFPIE